MGSAYNDVSCIDGALTTREIQLESLKILKAIDGICRSEGIRYWLMYGSLLGAVRHHGFIPWDDDLDIAMPRPDYEKFLAVFSERRKEFQSLESLTGNGGNGIPFLISRISNTAYKMVGEFGDDIPDLGVFVDIYPIDGCGNDLSIAKSKKNACRKAADSYIKAGNFRYFLRGDSRLKKALKSVRTILLGGPSRRAKKLFELCLEANYETSSYVACLVWPWDSNLIIEKKLCNTVEVPFEDITVPIPIGYDEILTMCYGSYSEYPPEAERVGHHNYSIFIRDAS